MAAGIGAAIGAAASKGFDLWYNSNSAKKAAKASYAYTIAAMNHQYELTRELNRNAYQDTTYSMREAGINPMLAINQGINGLTAGSGANISQQAAQSDMDLASALQLKNDTDRVKNETAQKDSTIALNKSTQLQNEANTANINENTKATKLNNDFLPKKQEAELRVLKAQERNYDANSAAAMTTAANNTRMTDSNIATNQQTANSAKQTAIQLQRNNDWYEKHPNWYNFSQAASAVGNVFRGGITGKVGK